MISVVLQVTVATHKIRFASSIASITKKKKKDLEAEQKRNEAEYTKDEKANVLTREASSEKPPSLGRRVKDVIKHALVI